MIIFHKFFRTIVLNLKVTKTFIQIFSKNWNLLTSDTQLIFCLKWILMYTVIIIRWPSLACVIWKVVISKILRYWNIATTLLTILFHNALDWAARSSLGINRDNLDNWASSIAVKNWVDAYSAKGSIIR